MGKLRIRRCKLNEKGSALLTVILVVAFLTILATTLLYVTGMNFMIKQADYRNKKNFYMSETALEEIKAMLIEDIVSEAAKEAYVETCINYSSAGNASVREVKYNEYFVDAVLDQLKSKLGTGDWPTYLKKGYESDAAIESHVKFEMVSSTVSKSDTDDLSADSTLSWDSYKGIVTITGLRLTYINDDALASIISTDLELHAPAIDWSAEQSEDTIEVIGSETAEKAEERAKTKQIVNVTRCVRYTNWVKK